jgi:hypothetical protein
MDLPWLIGGGVVCAWAVLRVLGAERERCVRELHHKFAVQAAEAAHTAKPVGGAVLEKSPVRSKVPR